MSFSNSQNPQCEGLHKERIFFDAKSPPTRLAYPIRWENSEYHIDAGSTQGISAGAEFAVYTDENAVRTANPLGILVVDRIDLFKTTLKPIQGGVPFGIGATAVAVQTKVGVKEDLALHVALDDKLSSVFEALLGILKDMDMENSESYNAKIALVGRNQAQLEIVREGEELFVRILDERVTVYGIKRIPFPINPDPTAIRPVLRAAAHYYRHFNSGSSMVGDKRYERNIGIQFFRRVTWLEAGESDDDDDWEICDWVEGCPFEITDNVYPDYRMKITNKSSRGLYLSVFYFDSNDLSIGECYGTDFAMHLLMWYL